MKKVSFLFLLLIHSAYAQQNLIGTWKASCPLKYEERTTIRHCELCPALIDSTGTHLTIQDFDFIVDQTTVTLTRDNVSHEGIPYSWNIEKHIISFSFNGKEYNLTAHYGDDDVVLLNDDGTMVFLKRKKLQ
jgi:hypothetical protein